jgi:hypothetical protein
MHDTMPVQDILCRLAAGCRRLLELIVPTANAMTDYVGWWFQIAVLYLHNYGFRIVLCLCLC